MRTISASLAAALLLPFPAAALAGTAAARPIRVAARAGARPAGLVPAQAAETGIGVNNPVIGKLTGEGNVSYRTALDVSNNTGDAHIATFVFDGTDLATGTVLPPITGNVVNPGQVEGADVTTPMDAYSNAHFDDFIATLRDSGLITSQEYDDGVIGSLLVVFLGTSSSGEGSTVARFYSSGCGGTIGVSARGEEITSNNPLKLVGVFRDTTGEAGVPQLYPNLFLNNVGITPQGGTPTDTGAVTVRLSAYSATNGPGVPVGQRSVGPIEAGQTAIVPHVLDYLNVPRGQFDTILVFAEVIDGESAIESLAVEVDQTTRDGSSVEMSRGDFFNP